MSPHLLDLVVTWNMCSKKLTHLSVAKHKKISFPQFLLVIKLNMIFLFKLGVSSIALVLLRLIVMELFAQQVNSHSSEMGFDHHRRWIMEWSTSHHLIILFLRHFEHVYACVDKSEPEHWPSLFPCWILEGLPLFHCSLNLTFNGPAVSSTQPFHWQQNLF